MYIYFEAQNKIFCKNEHFVEGITIHNALFTQNGKNANLFTGVNKISKGGIIFEKQEIERTFVVGCFMCTAYITVCDSTGC